MLEIEHLQAFWGDSHILQGLDLSLPAGHRLAVLGRNGAGKTTLFKSLLNAGPRTEGHVRWDGAELGTQPLYRRARLGLSLVPEDRRIFAHLSVQENLLIAAQAQREGVGVQGVDEMLQRFPMLKGLRARPGGQLSGGQQQMLAVARGLMARPRLLLLDEPTEGLAPLIVQQLARAVVQACEAAGTALFLSEQNVWFARQCTRELVVLDSGRIVFRGTWAEFDAAPQVKTRYLAV